MNSDEFLAVIDATPLVSIDLLIENANGEILLGQRRNRPARGDWFVPGGRIRKNESLAEAFRRISSTELGIELTISHAHLLGAFDHIYPDNFRGADGINTHYVALGYSLTLAGDAQIVADDQHAALRWFSKPELLSDSRVHENTKRYFAAV